MRDCNILLILGRSHAVKILAALADKPRRFVELEEFCKSNRTRAERLKELEQNGLIKRKALISGKRAYTAYEITSKGREALSLCRKLLQLE
ncbi:MAG: winged helix-turn-helix transcriptional regulator [Thermoproteota archaeon]